MLVEVGWLTGLLVITVELQLVQVGIASVEAARKIEAVWAVGERPAG